MEGKIKPINSSRERFEREAWGRLGGWFNKIVKVGSENSILDENPPSKVVK